MKIGIFRYAIHFLWGGSTGGTIVVITKGLKASFNPLIRDTLPLSKNEKLCSTEDFK